MRKRKDEKIYTTTVLSSDDLERSDEVVQQIRAAWDNLPDDVDMTEREMFVEIAAKVIKLHSALREERKSKDHLN